MRIWIAKDWYGTLVYTTPPKLLPNGSGNQKEWQNGARVVDQFEDNPMELSFAKGFLAGCIYMENKKK